MNVKSFNKQIQQLKNCKQIPLRSKKKIKCNTLPFLKNFVGKLGKTRWKARGKVYGTRLDLQCTVYGTQMARNMVKRLSRLCFYNVLPFPPFLYTSPTPLFRVVLMLSGAVWIGRTPTLWTPPLTPHTIIISLNFTFFFSWTMWCLQMAPPLSNAITYMTYMTFDSAQTVL